MLVFALLLHAVRGDLPVHCVHWQVAGTWMLHIGRYWDEAKQRYDPLCGYNRPDSPKGDAHKRVMPQGCTVNRMPGESKEDASDRCMNGDPAIMQSAFAKNFHKLGEARVDLAADNAGWAARAEATGRNFEAQLQAHEKAQLAKEEDLRANPLTAARGLWTMIYNEGWHISLADVGARQHNSTEDEVMDSAGVTHDFITFSSYQVGPGGPGSSDWKANAEYSNCAGTLIGWYHRSKTGRPEDSVTALDDSDRMCFWGEQVEHDPTIQDYDVPQGARYESAAHVQVPVAQGETAPLKSMAEESSSVLRQKAGRILGRDEYAELYAHAAHAHREATNGTKGEHFMDIKHRLVQKSNSVYDLLFALMHAQIAHGDGGAHGLSPLGFMFEDEKDFSDAEIEQWYSDRVQFKDGHRRKIWADWDAGAAQSATFQAGEGQWSDFDWRKVKVASPDHATRQRLHEQGQSRAAAAHGGQERDGPVERAVDQGPCGSCYDVAVASMLTARLWIRYPDLQETWKGNGDGAGEGDRTVSWRHNLHCNQMNQGCEGGYPYYSLQWGQDTDLPDSQCFPHDVDVSEAVQEKTLFDQPATMCDGLVSHESKPCEYAVRVHRFGYIGGSYGLCHVMQTRFPGQPEYSCEFAMRAEMYRGGPIGVAIEPGPSFGGSGGGVYRCPEQMKNEVAGYPGESKIDKLLNVKEIKPGEVCEGGMDCFVWSRVDHAIIAVGWGVSEEGVKYWIIQNSWGEGFGDGDGTMKIERGVDCMAIESITVTADPVLTRRTENVELEGDAAFGQPDIPVECAGETCTVGALPAEYTGMLSAGDRVVAAGPKGSEQKGTEAELGKSGTFKRVIAEPATKGKYFERGAADSLRPAAAAPRDGPVPAATHPRAAELAMDQAAAASPMAVEKAHASASKFATDPLLAAAGMAGFAEVDRTPSMRGSKRGPDRAYVLGL